MTAIGWYDAYTVCLLKINKYKRNDNTLLTVSYIDTY